MARLFSNSEFINMYCAVYGEACGSAPRPPPPPRISVRLILVGVHEGPGIDIQLIQLKF
jgi:hypothetical protein